MTFEVEGIWEAYTAERPAYEELAKRVCAMLKDATRRCGIRCDIDGRAKTVDSFMKKALRPGKEYRDPLAEIKDKAGVRVVVTYKAVAGHIEDIISELFLVHNRDDKSSDLEVDRLGYQGIHFEVGLRDADIGPDEWTLRHLACEIQLHTRAQNLWANISHELLYKPPQRPVGEVARGIYRLVALVELFDQEVVAARDVILSQPDFREAMMLNALEHHYYELTGRSYDTDLSLEVTKALRPLLNDEEVQRFDTILDDFVNENRAKLEDIFRRYTGNQREGLLLYQPESLLVFELLEKDEFSLKEAWMEILPLEFLERLAAIWGRAL